MGFSIINHPCGGTPIDGKRLDGRVPIAQEEALNTLAAAAGSMEKDKARNGGAEMKIKKGINTINKQTHKPISAWMIQLMSESIHECVN